MAEQRARTEQAVVVVDVEVVEALREQFRDPRDLVELLGDVALAPGVGILGEKRPGQLELLGRAGHREARRDRVAEAAAAAPAFDQRARIVVAAPRRIEQCFGRVTIHQRLAGVHPQLACLGGLEERVDRLRVDGAIDRGRRRPVRQARVEEQVGDAARVRVIGELALGGERVVVEPVDQPLAAGADDLGLRIMDVRVDEAGNDQRIAIGRDRQSRGHLRGQRAMVAERDDATLVDHDQRVGLVMQRRFVTDDEGIVAQRQGRRAEREGRRRQGRQGSRRHRV